MKAIDTGAVDRHGARVPLSPPGSGGASNGRDAVVHVAQALMKHALLPQGQATAVAGKALKELTDEIGCVIVDDQIKLPNYTADGKSAGTRGGRGLVCRWDLVP